MTPQRLASRSLFPSCSPVASCISPDLCSPRHSPRALPCPIGSSTSGPSGKGRVAPLRPCRHIPPAFRGLAWSSTRGPSGKSRAALPRASRHAPHSFCGPIGSATHGPSRNDRMESAREFRRTPRTFRGPEGSSTNGTGGTCARGFHPPMSADLSRVSRPLGNSIHGSSRTGRVAPPRSCRRDPRAIRGRTGSFADGPSGKVWTASRRPLRRTFYTFRGPERGSVHCTSGKGSIASAHPVRHTTHAFWWPRRELHPLPQWEAAWRPRAHFGAACCHQLGVAPVDRATGRPVRPPGRSNSCCLGARAEQPALFI